MKKYTMCLIKNIKFQIKIVSNNSRTSIKYVPRTGKVPIRDHKIIANNNK